jgi:hypothetical protein
LGTDEFESKIKLAYENIHYHHLLADGFHSFKKEFELDAVAGCRSTFDAPSDEGLSS